MTYKTILVHVDRGTSCPARIDIAIRLARRFDARLVGLHALTAMKLPVYPVAESLAIVDAYKRFAMEHAKQAEAMFTRAVDRNGPLMTEWRVSPDDVLEAAALHARYADLVIVGQPEPANGSGVAPDMAHRLVLAIARPMLVVPYAGRFDTLGKRVMLAWNGRREATRAATDALPLLRAADEVQVVTVNRGAARAEEPGADIALYLARHGVRVNVIAVNGASIDAGNELLSRAADLGADLIVMGAYGRSRLGELLLGGVTRTMFASMTVPVLMSH